MPRSAWPIITVCMLRVGKGNIMKSVIAIIKKSMLTKNINDIPRYLRDSTYSYMSDSENAETYKYPHSYENSYVEQQYLPDSIKNEVYYCPGNNKFEKNATDYINKIKSMK